MELTVTSSYILLEKIVDKSSGENTSCNKAVMKRCIKGDLNNVFHNLPTSGSIGKILYADVYNRAQQTSNMNQWLHKCKTIMTNIPGGTSSRVNNHLMLTLTSFSRIMCENVSNNIYTQIWRVRLGKTTHRKGKHVLTAKWVADAWDRVKKQRDVIKHLKNVVCQTIWIGVRMILWLLKK